MRPLTLLVSLMGPAALTGLPAPAAAQDASVPAWLQPHVGDGAGQISEVVLQRAHGLYRRKVSEGTVKNGCYFAMDATRPNYAENGALARRFYVICDGDHSFRAISAGHGAGRDLAGFADFSNGRNCAKNFGNAQDSELTAGGNYVTAETKTTFKGYYHASANHDAAFARSFVQFDGEGETANARERAIGGHASVTLKGVCLRKDPANPHASPEGYVRFGTLVDYSGGRSNGCTSWSKSDVTQMLSIVKDEPTTLYIYPAAADIEAVSQAVASGQPLSRSGVYWNATCLRDIRSPTYWSRERLEPLIARYRAIHLEPPARSIPLCSDQHKLSAAR